MSIKNLGIALIVIGILAMAVSLLADVLGIGGYPAAIGPLQLGGAAIGLVIAIIGGVLVFRKGKPKQ